MFSRDSSVFNFEDLLNLFDTKERQDDQRILRDVSDLTLLFFLRVFFLKSASSAM
jgi:hypothetical protein